MKQMYCVLIIFIINILIFPKISNAQDKLLIKSDSNSTIKAIEMKGKPKAKSDILYEIKIKDSWNNYRVYKYNEISQVSRTYSDSTTRNYKKETTFFFTLYYRNPPENGFLKMDVVIDSLIYKFTEGDAVIDFNTNADNNKPVRFKDLEATSVPVGRSFDVTYSSYGDVVKIEGSDLDWVKNFMKENSDSNVDPITDFIWYDGISESRLKHLSDVRKVFIPTAWIPKDSIWNTPFEIQLNSITFKDTLKAIVSDVSAGYSTIEAKTNHLKVSSEKCFLYNVPDLVYIFDSKGDGIFSMSVNPKGVISHISGKFNALVKYQSGKQTILETIKTEMSWQMLGMYKL